MSRSLTPHASNEADVHRTAKSDRSPFRHILVATDFSQASAAALQHATSFARHYRATLYIAHILPSDSTPAALAEAWRDGQRLETDLLVTGQLRGVEHQLIVSLGEIWDGLAKIVKEKEVDLIVVGTRGRTGLARVLLGSVAERIFRQASCPVLTVGPRTQGLVASETAIRRILFPTDFSPPSISALPYALSLAKLYSANLALLHVAQAPVESASKESCLADARAKLEGLIPENAGLIGKADIVVGFGTPATRILAVAAEQMPDLIVLGLRQPGGPLSGRRWTTASEITGKANCPVLTVRAA